MRRLLHGTGDLPKIFALFLVVMTLVSTFGGYQLSKLLNQMNDVSQQRADKLLIIEMGLDDAEIALGAQIQEWKDMLLRADNADLYRKHWKSFQDSSVGVQYALMNTKSVMQEVGLDTAVIDQLSTEHKSLVSSYLAAHVKLDPAKIESSHVVDRLVMGSDRDLQQHLAEVKDQLERLAQLQLQGDLPGQETRNWMIGLLAGTSLLVMALLGFVFAFRLHGHDELVDEY